VSSRAFNELVEEIAQSYVLADGWLIADPQDPEMRRHLLEEDGLDAAMAIEVLLRMEEIAAELGFAEMT
jgi:hypothetical protein